MAQTGPGAGSGSGAGGAAAADALQKLADGLDKVAGKLAAAQRGLNAFAAGMDRVLGSLGSQFTRFVEKANPGVVIRFNMALDNLTAAIGQVLAPAVERFTGVVQKLGNAIASLDGPTKSLLGGLAAGSALAGALGGVASALATVVGLLGGWVTALVAVGAATAGLLTMTAGWKELSAALDTVLKVVGTVVQAVAAPLAGVLGEVGRVLAAVVGAIAPVLQVIGEALAPVLTVVGAVLKPFIQVIGMFTGVLAPVVKLVGSLLSVVTTFAEAGAKVVAALGENTIGRLLGAAAEALKWFADAVGRVVEQIKKFVNEVRETFGLDPAYDPNKKTAQAAGKAEISSDLRGIINRAYTTAATATAASVEQQQLDRLGKIDEKLGSLPDRLAKALGDRLKAKVGVGEAQPWYNHLPTPVPGVNVGDVRAAWNAIFG